MSARPSMFGWLSACSGAMKSAVPTTAPLSSRSVSLSVAARRPGQPHVEDLDRAALVAHQVAGLDVAVDEPLLVRVLQSGRGLRDVLGRGRVRDRAVAIEDLLERLAVDVLHDEVGHVVVPRDVEDADDVRVVERRGRAGLAEEPLERELLVLVAARHEHLDRDLAVQFQVLREVDRAHPAAAEHVLDDVAADPEPLVPAGEELLGLKARQQSLRDELGRGLLRLVRQAQVGQCRELCRAEAARSS